MGKRNSKLKTDSIQELADKTHCENKQYLFLFSFEKTLEMSVLNF